MNIVTKNRKKRRISTQLMFGMMTLVVLLILAFGLLNNLFLKRYYRLNKQKEILQGFNIIGAAAASGILETEEFDIDFERICANGNISIIVFGDDKLAPIRTSLTDIQEYRRELLQLMASPITKDNLIRQSDNYTLAMLPDSRMNEDYLIFWGVLETGELVYMRTALESIRESADITNRFFMFVAFFGILLGVGISFIIARRISRPVRELTDISEHMTKLEFDVRYQDKKGVGEEISLLGNHMNRLSETLEQTISELKAANLNLQEDIQKKEEIDEMRKEFLSNVSHELKTPLALIRGYAEGLEDCINDDPESRSFYCDVIIDEAEKMDRMVKKLLTLNQLEFGNEKLDMQRFDITELINGLIMSSSLLASQDNITLYSEQKEPLYVWGDEFKVEEVLTNYMSNAIHYASGEKQVRVSCTTGEKLVRISVFNTGSQIPEEDLDKVWIKFYKVDKARTREYGGNGIGLSIVKAIMDSFHQECGVINHEDGVEFWMELELG